MQDIMDKLSKSPTAQKTLFVTTCTVVGAVAAPQILGLVGFTATGPAAGSAAAAWQSSIGSVASGSLFSIVQSTAMTTGGYMAGGIAGAATSVSRLAMKGRRHP